MKKEPALSVFVCPAGIVVCSRKSGEEADRPQPRRRAHDQLAHAARPGGGVSDQKPAGAAQHLPDRKVSPRPRQVLAISILDFSVDARAACGAVWAIFRFFFFLSRWLLVPMESLHTPPSFGRLVETVSIGIVVDAIEYLLTSRS